METTSEDQIQVVPSKTGSRAVTDSNERIQQFRDDVANLGMKQGQSRNEKLLGIAGGVLLAVGVVLAIIGAVNVSGTTNAADQRAMVMSGGILGLVLVVAGGVLFLRYSITKYMRLMMLRMAFESQTASDRNAESLSRIEAWSAHNSSSGPR